MLNHLTTHNLPNSGISGQTSLPKSTTNIDLSIIVPVFNEEASIERLYVRLTESLHQLGKSFEIIIIDDGSTDASFQVLAKIAADNKQVKVIKFARNYGQTAALAAGIDYASGQVVIPIDADLQNDPQDIMHLLAKLDEGYDVVSGWRKNRQDHLITRLIPSWIANKIISVISGVNLHDYGCSLKAYRKEVIKEIKLYGEMHRFVPIYATWMGGKVTEIPVNHYARNYGKSKYGISRTFKVVLDLITVKFLAEYATKPIYVFGAAGLWSAVAAMLIFIWMVVLKYCYHTTFIQTPLPVLSVMFLMLGVQFILMGLLAEMLMRTYHESQDKRIYMVKTTLNVAERDKK